MQRHQGIGRLACFVNGTEPLVDCRLFGWKARQQCLTILRLGVRDPELESRQSHDVVGICTSRELQRTVTEPGQQTPELSIIAGLRAYTAEVVNARGELPLLPPERLRLTAGRAVLFQQQHALAALAQGGGRGQSSYA